VSGEPIRVGFLSGIRHARSYAALLAARPDVEIVGVAEDLDVPDWMVDESRQLARDLAVPFVEGTEALADPARVDLAMVCSEPVRHAALTAAAASAGLHVCCDKPVAVDLAGADAVVAAAAASPRVCAVVHRTLSPAMRRLRSYVDAGAVGLPLHLDVEFFSSAATFAADVERPELVVDPRLSGGGEMRNFLGYAVDAVRHLTGLEVVEVFAEAGTLFGGPHAATGVEDSAVVSLLLDRGVTATATISRPPAVPAPGSSRSAVRLVGSHGHAAANDETPRVLEFRGTATTAHPLEGAGLAALHACFDDVLRAVASGGSPGYTVEDARAGVAVVDAAFRAAATGRNVRLAAVLGGQ
jgi:predicted dehydrogenase